MLYICVFLRTFLFVYFSPLFFFFSFLPTTTTTTYNSYPKFNKSIIFKLNFWEFNFTKNQK